MAADRVTDQAEVLAYHYGEALDLALAADGQDVGELRELTVRHLVAAGDRAARIDAESAERNFRRAVELLPERTASAPASCCTGALAVRLGKELDGAPKVRSADSASMRAARSPAATRWRTVSSRSSPTSCSSAASARSSASP